MCRENDVLEQHARRVLIRALTNKALDAIRAKAEEDATSIPLPSQLHQQVAAALRHQPDISWDIAVANMACKWLREEGTNTAIIPARMARRYSRLKR